MTFDKPIHRIAIVGTGVIGASWAAQYLARGFDVVATDPAPDAEAKLRKYVDDAWDAARRHRPVARSIARPPVLHPGHEGGAGGGRLRPGKRSRAARVQDEALRGHGRRHACRHDHRVELLGDHAERDAVEVQAPRARPRRASVQPAAHHSTCGSGGRRKTSPQAIQRAMAFYASIGKKPIHLRKELPGHVANRLQAALYREMLYLIEQGVLSVEDTDAAVCYGPGLRWGVMGQSLQWHLGGGAGGIKHFMDHLMDPLAGHDEGPRHSKHHARAEANHHRWRDARSRGTLGRSARARRERGVNRTSQAASEWFFR